MNMTDYDAIAYFDFDVTLQGDVMPLLDCKPSLVPPLARTPVRVAVPVLVHAGVALSFCFACYPCAAPFFPC